MIQFVMDLRCSDLNIHVCTVQVAYLIKCFLCSRLAPSVLPSGHCATQSCVLVFAHRPSVFVTDHCLTDLPFFFFCCGAGWIFPTSVYIVCRSGPAFYGSMCRVGPPATWLKTANPADTLFPFGRGCMRKCARYFNDCLAPNYN